MNYDNDVRYKIRKEATNGAAWSFTKCWECAIQQYGLPFLQYCISTFYVIYTYCTPINVALFFVKSVPTGMYVFNFVKNVYVTSQDHMKVKQMELEELQLQIQIVNTKLSVRDAECTDRAEELRRGTERLRRVRARVREVIAADQGLRHAFHEIAPWEDDPDTQLYCPPEEREFIVELLKELKYDQVQAADSPTEMDCGEQVPADSGNQAESVYSSASDTDLKQNCRVKILKVTNVYKVAYLKHYIKQKKLRRANKHAVLKKKVESIKKSLDDWIKTLNMVINTKLAILDSQYGDIASQEAMGDHMKQDPRGSSDSDSDFRNTRENDYDQRCLKWAENTLGNFTRSFEDGSDCPVEGDYGDSQYSDKCQCQSFHTFESTMQRTPNVLFSLPEETSSLLAIEEAKSEASNEYECQDAAIE